LNKICPKHEPLDTHCKKRRILNVMARSFKTWDNDISHDDDQIEAKSVAFKMVELTEESKLSAPETLLMTIVVPLTFRVVPTTAGN
jgi:hypothetical protein